MKRFTILLSLAIYSIIFSQDPVVHDWTLNFPPRFDYKNFSIVDMEKDNQGNLYTTGYVQDIIDDNLDIITLKVIMSSGIVEWVRIYNGAGNRDDFPTDLEIDNEGNCFISGYTFKTRGQYLILKYNPDGQEVWEADSNNFITDFLVDDVGNIYVTGYSTIKYNSNGDLVWRVDYNNSTAGYGITIDDTGNVYVTGSLNNDDFLTIKYNANGEEQWARSYNDLQDRADYVALDNEGNIYSAGANVGGNTGDFGFWILKYDQQGNLLWYKKYSAIWADISGFALSPSGNVFITGSYYPASSQTRDYITLKYNSNGIFQWAKSYNGPASMDDIPNDLKIDLNENVYITGYRSWANQMDAITIKYNSSGDSLWAHSYSNFNVYANGRKIVLGSSNDLYVGLLVSSPVNTTVHPNILKLNANGTQRWISDFKGFCQPTAIKKDNEGSIYITGFGGLNQYMRDYITMKCDSSGNIKWIRTYDGPADSSDEAYDIEVDEDGNVYVTGGSKGLGTNYDFTTIKYDSSGNELWVVRYNAPAFGSDIASFISVDANGNVYISGSSINSNSSFDIATVKYNNLGQLQWVKRYNGSADGNDLAQGLEVDISGNIFVTGTSDSTGSLYDYVTLKYNSSGDIEWIKRYNGPANDGDLASEMSIDSSGNVYVTGWSFGNDTQTDYATVKYNSSGDEQWAARWDDPASSYDYAYDIAVDGNQNVYVTGVSQGMGTDNDFTTVKYNSLGEQQWAIPYNGESNGSDIPYNIALDYLGDVYVAGYSNNNTEYAVIKYNGEGILQWNESYIFEDYQSTPTDLLVDNSGNVIVAGFSSKAGEEWIWSIVKYKQPDFIQLDTKEEVNSPSEFVLYQNYPNPFNPSTSIQYAVGSMQFVTLKVYDILGREVVSLVNEEKHAGTYKIKFDASGLASGIYLYRLQAGSFSEAKKMIVIK